MSKKPDLSLPGEDNAANTTLYRASDACDFKTMYESITTANVALLEEIKSMKEQIQAVLQAGAATNIAPRSESTPNPHEFIPCRSPEQLPPLPPLDADIPPRHYRANWEPRKLVHLPIFTGAKGEWPGFIASYEATSRRYQYDQIENYMRLQKAIKGDALDSVRTLMIHAENVELVLDELQEQYGQAEEITREYIKEIRTLPAIASSRQVDVINFSRDLSNIVGFLSAVEGGTERLRDQTLLEELVAKLPFSKREQWANHYFGTLNRKATIETFASWIKIQANCLRLARDTGPEKPEPNRSRPICSTDVETEQCETSGANQTCANDLRKWDPT